MEIINKFNKIGNCQLTALRHLIDIKEGSIFAVSKMKYVKTQYGDKLVAVLIDSDNNWEEFRVYLPDRFNENLKENDVKAMNGIEDLVFVYKEMKDIDNNKKLHIIEFRTADTVK